MFIFKTCQVVEYICALKKKSCFSNYIQGKHGSIHFFARFIMSTIFKEAKIKFSSLSFRNCKKKLIYQFQKFEQKK